MNKSIIRKNITSISILLFVVIFALIQLINPSFLYNEDGSLREFGLGTKKKTVWTYDHNHKTGNFRGIICQPCNSILGNLQDDPTIAEKVIEYISTWQT